MLTFFPWQLCPSSYWRRPVLLLFVCTFSPPPCSYASPHMSPPRYFSGLSVPQVAAAERTRHCTYHGGYMSSAYCVAEPSCQWPMSTAQSGAKHGRTSKWGCSQRVRGQEAKGQEDKRTSKRTKAGLSTGRECAARARKVGSGRWHRAPAAATSPNHARRGPWRQRWGDKRVSCYVRVIHPAYAIHDTW